MGVTSKEFIRNRSNYIPRVLSWLKSLLDKSYCSVSQTSAPQATLRDCAKGSIIRPSRAVRLQAHTRDSQRGQNRLSRPNRPNRKATGWKPHNAAFADFAGVQLSYVFMPQGDTGMRRQQRRAATCGGVCLKDNLNVKEAAEAE